MKHAILVYDFDREKVQTANPEALVVSPRTELFRIRGHIVTSIEARAPIEIFTGGQRIALYSATTSVKTEEAEAARTLLTTKPSGEQNDS